MKYFVWAKISEDKLFVSEKHRKRVSQVIFAKSMEDFANMATSPDRVSGDDYIVDHTNWNLLIDKFGIGTVAKWDLVCQ